MDRQAGLNLTEQWNLIDLVQSKYLRLDRDIRSGFRRLMLQITFGSKNFNMLLDGLGRLAQGFRNFSHRRSHPLLGKISLNEIQHFLLLLSQFHESSSKPLRPSMHAFTP